MNSEDIDQRDPLKSLRVHMLLLEQVRQEDRTARQLLWLRSMLLMIDPHGSPERKSKVENEHKAFCKLLDAVLDDDTDHEDYQTKMGQALRRDWEQRFGELRDKDTQAGIDKVAAGLRRMRQLNGKRLRQSVQ